MYNDRVRSYLYKKGKSLEKPKTDLPPRDPVDSEVADLRRKSSAFRNQGNVLMQNASIQTSHKREAQLTREAQVAFQLADEYQEKAKLIVEGRTDDGMKTAIGHASITKREDGVDYTARHFLDVPDPQKPSTWGLRVYEKVEGSILMTRAQLGRAAAALGPNGFMGNRYKVRENGKSMDELKRALLSKYRSLNVPDDDIPPHILAMAHSAEEEIFDLDFTSPVEFDAIIEHYGRKGQRWGQRIFSKKSGGSEGSGGKGKASSDGEKSKETKTKTNKKVKKMTDQELSQAIRRMQMEKQYRELSNSKKSKGQSAVRKVLADSGKKALGKHATKLMFDAMTYGIQKAKPSYQPKF